MSKKLMTRSEAAEYLGVSPQTISNYYFRGLVHGKKFGRTLLYFREEVEQLARSAERLHTLESMETEIERKEGEVTAQYDNTRRMYEERKAEFLSEFGGHQKWVNYRRLAETVIDIVARDTLTDRERGVVHGVLYLHTLGEIADNYGLTAERVRQIFDKCLQHLCRFRTYGDERVTAAEAKVNSLIQEIDRLNDEIYMLKHPEAQAPAPTGNDIYRFSEPYTTKLVDCYFSVRTFNGLRHAGIETVGDIVAYRKEEFLRIRNFGRKSLNELELFLERMNLSFKMWTNPLRPKLSDPIVWGEKE